MDFARPDVTVVPLIVGEGRLKAVLLHHAGPGGSAKLRLVRGAVDPDRDEAIDLCARRLLREQLTEADAALIECRISTGRDRIAENRDDVDGNRASPAWGVRALYMGLLRPSALDGLRGKDVALFDLHEVFSIPAFEEEEGGIQIAGRGIDTMILNALKGVEAEIARKSQITKLPGFLVEPEFTLSELQEAYEAASGIPIDAANFRRKADQLGLVHPVGQRTGTSRRPAATYTLLGADLCLDRNIFGGGSRPMTT